MAQPPTLAVDLLIMPRLSLNFFLTSSSQILTCESPEKSAISCAQSPLAICRASSIPNSSGSESALEMRRCMLQYTSRVTAPRDSATIIS